MQEGSVADATINEAASASVKLTSYALLHCNGGPDGMVVVSLTRYWSLGAFRARFQNRDKTAGYLVYQQASIPLKYIVLAVALSSTSDLGRKKRGSPFDQRLDLPRKSSLFQHRRSFTA